MHILVTGSAGFVGAHLCAHLHSLGHTVTGVDISTTTGNFTTQRLDLCDAACVNDMISACRPDAVAHLAAQTFVPDGDHHPERMLAANVGTSWNLLRALARWVPRARLLLVSSAQVYGVAQDENPVAETTPVRPHNLYALSKAAAELACMGNTGNGPRWIIVRPGNHAGPGQSERFVIPAFIQQLRHCRRDPQRPILVGNLDSIRDFTDVRDVVDGYANVLESGVDSTVYNLSANHRVRMGDLLDRLCERMGVNPARQCSPERYRPTDMSPSLDIRKIQKDCNWSPRFSLHEMLIGMTDEP